MIGDLLKRILTPSVPESTAMDLQMKLIMLSLQYEELKGKWNALVDTINRRGGKAFLDGDCKVLNGEPAPQFSKQEIRKLILLCHPDKHHGHPDAHEITLKLLALKGK